VRLVCPFPLDTGSARVADKTGIESRRDAAGDSRIAE
jgi:hypothetical protein